MSVSGRLTLQAVSQDDDRPLARLEPVEAMLEEPALVVGLERGARVMMGLVGRVVGGPGVPFVGEVALELEPAGELRLSDQLELRVGQAECDGDLLLGRGLAQLAGERPLGPAPLRQQVDHV